MAIALASFVGLAPANDSDRRQTSKREELRVERTAIPFEAKVEFSRTVGPGRIVRVREGREGEVVRTWSVIIENGKVVGRKLVSMTKVDPIHPVYHMGRAGFQTSRGSFGRHRVLTMEATAYDPSAGRGRNATFRTKTGRRAEFGVVAVDPKVIPLNTLVFVEGYGFAIAADIGGAIRGDEIDLCVPTRQQALEFGRRKVRVHILR
jgi:3D (Asp-Asp-Asp) domain-containing protein